jgi:UDP:flavonoid glycosyltransferase YjiC (YdhE family)
LRALANDDVLVVATTLDFTPLGLLPANARVERFIPYSVLLPQVDVMVTNGGYGGVNAALAHGVPLVAAGASEDKRGVDARIAWAGVGIDLRTGTPSSTQLAQAVRTVLRDPTYRHNAERIRAECAQHDGPTEAALLLERLATTRAPVVGKD